MELKENKVVKKEIYLLIFIFSIFLVHQIFYISIGGTTWDEPASIYNGTKQLQKAKLFFQDFNNPVLKTISGPEFYGGIAFMPAVLVTRSSEVIEIFSKLFSLIPTIDETNNLEVALTIRHIFLNVYLITILLLCYRKLRELIGVDKSIVFLIIYLLIPSINGHALFNFADIPLAVHFLLASIYFISYLDKLDSKKNFIIGILFGLTLLTRINSVAFLLSLSLFEFIQKINKSEKQNYRKSVIKLFLKNLQIYLTAILLLFIGTPAAWRVPFVWLEGAYIFQFKHPQKAPTLINGKLIIADEAPRTYLIEWLIYKLPVAIIVLFIISIYLFLKKKELNNQVSKFSLFFILYVFLAFFIYNPVAYDEIRHYLFLIPFFILIVVECIFYLFRKNNQKRNIAILFISIYLVFNQFGLGAYKYVYLNELVDRSSISIDCKEYVAQSGCGNWHTDYWGFGGKQLVALSNNYENQKIYYCPPQFTYSMFQKEDRPWDLNAGSFSFDDSYPFEQEKYFYYSSHMIEKIKDSNFESITFLSLNYHRPPTDSCALSTLNKDDYTIDCQIVDGINVKLRGEIIPINYLSQCTVKKI